MRDVITVLRTNGERTAGLAADLLRAQFKNVHVLRIAPFGAAVRECFRLAIESRAQWLVTVDGDVLVADDCAGMLDKMARGLKPYQWQAIGHVDDKLAGRARLGGIRLYRVGALPAMLPYVRDDVVRPEGELCVRNPDWMRCAYITGKHDFEQWFADLHRKGAQHRVKHESWGRSIVAHWRVSADLDLMAAWAGWEGKPLVLAEKEPL